MSISEAPRAGLARSNGVSFSRRAIEKDGRGRWFAQVPVELWRDDDFRSLGAMAQLTYVKLLTSQDLNSAGSTLVFPNRRSGETADVTPAAYLGSVRELESTSWVYPDWDTEELFVSGYFVAENVAKQPRRIISALDTIQSMIDSKMLQAIASAELGALIVEPHIPPPPRGVRLAVLRRDGFRCVRCGWRPGDQVPAAKRRNGDRPTYRTLELDHIWPRSLGGPDEQSNFQVLCTSCNCSKGARV